MNNIKEVKNPYRPLRTLEKEDRNILIGRDNDIDNFMSALSDWTTKVMILDGEPGVGKSSFLRSGLVQEIKKTKQFDIIEFNGEHVISCGADPIENIVHSIFSSNWKSDFMKKSRKNRDESIENLRKELLGSLESEESLKDFLKKKEGISNFFSLLSLYIHNRKILILDHIEQLFILPSSGIADHFLEGIKYFATRDCNAVIVLSIRADFLALLRNKIYNYLLSENIRDMYLSDIENEDYLIKAIEKPCEDAGCCFSDKSIPRYISKKIIDKKINNVSVLPILHIICFFIFENMLKRTAGAGIKEKIISDKDAQCLDNKNYVFTVASFVKNIIENICVNDVGFSKHEILDILYMLVEKSYRYRKIIEKDQFIDIIKNKLKITDDRKIKDIILYLNEERLIVYSEYKITLSHDLVTEAVVFLKTGLIDVFENKRDPGIEDAMINILNEFKSKFKEYPSEKLRIASVVGKQFFHKNGNLYQHANDMLETIKKYKFIAQDQSIKVLVIKPFSKLFLYRAESEIGLPLDNYYHKSVHNDIWDWKDNRIFIDSSITIARLKFLIENYKEIIDARLSDFMPISILSYTNQTVFNPYTFAAHERKKENEEWCGALPTYHHEKKSYQEELKDHFDYLWNKSVTIEEFLEELRNDDDHREYKKKFLDRLLLEYKKQETVL